MQLITNPPDIHYLLNNGFWAHDGIRLLIGKHVKYILWDPRTSGPLRALHPDWEVLDTPEEIEEALAKADSIEYDTVHTSDESARHLRETYSNVLGSHEEGATKTTDQLRRIKTPEEIEAITQSQRINEQAFRNILPMIREGITEKDVLKLIKKQYIDLGAEDVSFHPIVGFQENGSIPHHESSDRILKKWDQILIDMGCIVDGYCSDMTRMIFTDNPTHKQKEILDILIDTTHSLVNYIKVGMSWLEIQQHATELLWEYGQYFTHGLWHGIGLEIHELPFLSTKEDRDFTVEDGMVFTIEPGIYIEGEIGSRFEIIVAIENGKPRIITNMDERIQINIRKRRTLHLINSFFHRIMS